MQFPQVHHRTNIFSQSVDYNFYFYCSNYSLRNTILTPTKTVQHNRIKHQPQANRLSLC